jgi:predicted metal-dependent HD superfamily phosphohydrolase
MTSIEEQGTYMYNRWKCLCERVQITDEQAIESLWKDLKDHYDEPQRAYHTLTHIYDLLTKRDELERKINDIVSVDLAIFYHDIIYDPKSATNEEDSAVHFERVMTPYLPKFMINKVNEYIMATKAHSVLESDDFDLQVFIDMDMSILGHAWSDYYAYAAKVRTEYQHVPIEAYCRQRAAFLRHFIETVPYIYASREYRSMYEDSARDNISRECEILDHGLVPNKDETNFGGLLSR